MNRIRHIFSAVSAPDAALSSHPAMSLALCLVVLLSCAALFCGSTFAWFTDTASCSVEQIRAADTFANSADPAANEEGMDADTPELVSDAPDDGAAVAQGSSSQNSSAQGSVGQDQIDQSSVGQNSADQDPTSSSSSGAASAPSVSINPSSSSASGDAGASDSGASSFSASAERAS